MLENMPEDMLEYMLEDMLNRMSENILDRMLEDLPVRKCINIMVGIIWSKVINFSWGLVCFLKNKCYFLKI